MGLVGLGEIRIGTMMPDRPEDAIAEYRATLRLRLDSSVTHNNLG